jgi:hypothetical protein
MRRLILPAAFLLLLSVAATADTFFNFQFAGDAPTQITVSGTLDAVANGDGSFTAVSGAGTLVLHGDPYELALSQDPYSPEVDWNSNGLGFYYNNQLYPYQNPTVDYYGLLFTFTGAVPNSVDDGLNIYYNAPDYNAYIQWSGVNQNGDFTLSAVPSTVSGYLTNETAVVIHTPEAGALSLLSIMLAGVGGLAGVLRRKLA